MHSCYSTVKVHDLCLATLLYIYITWLFDVSKQFYTFIQEDFSWSDNFMLDFFGGKAGGRKDQSRCAAEGVDACVLGRPMTCHIQLGLKNLQLGRTKHLSWTKELHLHAFAFGLGRLLETCRPWLGPSPIQMTSRFTGLGIYCISIIIRFWMMFEGFPFSMHQTQLGCAFAPLTGRGSGIIERKNSHPLIHVELLPFRERPIRECCFLPLLESRPPKKVPKRNETYISELRILQDVQRYVRTGEELYSSEHLGQVLRPGSVGWMKVVKKSMEKGADRSCRQSMTVV